MTVTDIKDKTIVVTGASTGIGAATAELLAEQGATVVLGARRPEPLTALAERIQAAGGRALALPTDVTRRDDVAALVRHAIDATGQIDALVSVAGVMPISRLAELRVDDWDAMIDVNLKGVLHGIAAALPVFREQGFGHFVTVSSTADRTVVPAMAVYAASKFGVRALMNGLRQECAPEGIRVTTVSPGMTATETALSGPDEAVRARVRELAMPPASVARTIAFALGEPGDVNVGEIVVRPTAQA